MKSVDADALKDAIYCSTADGDKADWAVSVINDVPTVDTVEVVRCEDCDKSNEWVNGRWCRRFCTFVNADSYCSFGEKRKER